jgi:GTPase SAR1 family protein
MPQHQTSLFSTEQCDPNLADTGLKVAYAVFQRSEPFSMSLFEGFTSLRVLTYSVSIPMTVKMLHRFEHIECVFGYEGIINDFSTILAVQKELSQGILMAVKGLERQQQTFILACMAEGNARFFVVKDAISHSKIYLLQGAGKKRVIVGSANLSDRAFSGKQAETIVVFDDDEAAWQHYEQEYEKVRKGATTEFTLPDLRIQEVALEDLPVLKQVEKTPGGVTLFVGTDTATASIPTVVSRIERLAASYNHVTKNLVQPKHNQIRLEQEIVGKVVRLIKSHRSTQETVEPAQFSVDIAAGTALLSGRALSLEVEEDGVSSDVALLTEYFNNYQNGFHGDVAKLQRDYFMFMSWFYISPFICDFRNRAIGGHEYIFDYPHFAVLYGKANCGKTRLIETLMRSMFGYHHFIEKGDFTRTNLRNLQINYRRFPAVFDDVEKRRFVDHATDVIKDEQFMLEEYPAFVLSMNADNHSFSTEIRKRCLMVYTNASLPDNTEKAKQLYSSVRAIQQSLGTSFYRKYLATVMASLTNRELPRDILHFSSELLVSLFDTYGRHGTPAWCTPININEYSDRKYENVRTELRKLYQTARSSWNIRRDEVILTVESYEAPGLRKEIPDWLLLEGNKGTNIVMNRKELEKFLGVRFQQGLLQRLLPWR